MTEYQDDFEISDGNPKPTSDGAEVKDEGATVHALKTYAMYFGLVLSGDKPFEVRKDDRGYSVGDILHLRETKDGTEEYTGRSLHRRITYLLRAAPHFGLVDGFVILGLASPPTGRTLTEVVTEEELDVARAAYKAVIEAPIFSGSRTHTLWRGTWFETRGQAMAARERDALRAAITAVERRVMGDVGAGDATAAPVGDIVLSAAGKSYHMRLTLGALAEIEEGLSVGNTGELRSMVQKKLRAADLAIAAAALLRGGGHDVTPADVLRLPFSFGEIENGVSKALRLLDSKQEREG